MDKVTNLSEKEKYISKCKDEFISYINKMLSILDEIFETIFYNDGSAVIN